MTIYPGTVYLTQDKSLGIFVPQEYNVAAKSLIDEVLAGASVAGEQVNFGVLRTLCKIVGEPAPHLDEKASPVVLTHAEAVHFENIMAQFVLRSDLRYRIKRVCQVCGRTTIEDPARVAERAEQAQRTYESALIGTRISATQLANSGHSGLAMLRWLAAPPKPSTVIYCPDCDSNDFELSPVTYCPDCRDRRDELVLVRCPVPDCDHDFTASVRDRVWTTSASALQQFNVSYKYSAVINAACALDDFARSEQVDFLLQHVTADTGIFGVARCMWINGRKRDTIMLVTSEGICWSSKRLLVLTGSDSLSWADVTGAARTNSATDDIELTQANGATITFGQFTGNGQVLGIGVPSTLLGFGVQTIRRLAASMSGRRS
jgi:hypothetical protein